MRHAQSTGNLLSADDRCTLDQANHRFELTEDGKAQAACLGQHLVAANRPNLFDAFYVSSYVRTQQTMDHLVLGKQVREDPRLDEWWKGIWYEYDEAYIDRWYPDEERIRKRAGVYHYRPPGGESGADVECRIRAFLTDLRLNHAGQNVLVVGHGRWIQWLHKVVNGHYAEGPIPNCSLSVCSPEPDSLCGLKFNMFANLPDKVRQKAPDLWDKK